MKKSVAFVTYSEQPGLTKDDTLAAESLLSITGIEVRALPWDTRGVAWQDFAAVVLRSTWDYFRRPGEFLQWLDQLESCQKRVFNSPALVRWNMEKTYLRDLESAGVPIVPTIWIERGQQVSLAGILEEHAWERAVVKPTISGAAYRTWVTSRDQARSAAVRSDAEAILKASGAMIQPFMGEIVESGEWSLIFIDGTYSHAILKTPALGDFRVQEQFGASRRLMDPPTRLHKEALNVIQATALKMPNSWPLYARVDGVVSKQDGRFLLMELELIEPVLSFQAEPFDAPRRFASAIANRLELD